MLVADGPQSDATRPAIVSNVSFFQCFNLIRPDFLEIDFIFLFANTKSLPYLNLNQSRSEKKVSLNA